MQKIAVFNATEFARFVFSGIVAASGNLAATWLMHQYVSFELSLLFGIATGFAISFTLSKWFAFGSRSWRRVGGEASRFIVIYALSSGIYWVIAVVIRLLLFAHGLSMTVAETCGILIGAGTMVLTSYFGHQFFTYRMHRGANVGFGGAS